MNRRTASTPSRDPPRMINARSPLCRSAADTTNHDQGHRDARTKWATGRSLPDWHLHDHRQRAVSGSNTNEPAQVDPHRYVAAVQRHATTLTGTRTHGQSAFTLKSTTGSEIDHASGGPHSGMAPQAGHESGGAPGGAGIPSRRRRECSRPGAGVEVVQPSGAPPRPPRLACFRTSPPTRRDTRFRPLPYEQNKPPSCCLRAVTRGQWRSPAVR
jgi:hypothetical protein